MTGSTDGGAASRRPRHSSREVTHGVHDEYNQHKYAEADG